VTPLKKHVAEKITLLMHAMLMASVMLIVRGAHHPFDQSCPIFFKYKLINTIIAFCNVNQLKPRDY